MASAQLSATIDYSGTAADGEFVYDGADGPLPPLSATAYVYDAMPELVRACRAPRATYTPAGGARFLSVAAVRDAGREADRETGLDYFGARYFSSARKNAGRKTRDSIRSPQVFAPHLTKAAPPPLPVRFSPMADVADLDGLVRGVDEEEPVVADPQPQLFRIALERFEVPGAGLREAM